MAGAPKRTAAAGAADAARARGMIEDEARRLGFDAVGFARAAQAAGAAEGLREFLARRLHGGMDWMERRAEQRADPLRLWPAARSVVVLGVNYGPESDPLAALAERSRGVVSTYARGRDYHDVVKVRLKRLAGWMAATFDAEVKVFVDTAPLMEKPLAEAGGLGWQGKHTNLVSRTFGSWLFLGEVFTTLDLPPDAPVGDHCGTCRACLDACPTGAFLGPRRIDARRCISYLTIEHKAPIPRELRPLMGNRIYGCDDCLAVCPWNKFDRASEDAAFAQRAETAPTDLAALAGLDDAGFRARYAGTAIKRIGRDRFVRNVLNAIGNSGEARLAAAAEALLADASPLVRGAAAWALGRLDPARFAALRPGRLAAEADAEVRAEWEAAA